MRDGVLTGGMGGFPGAGICGRNTSKVNNLPIWEEVGGDSSEPPAQLQPTTTTGQAVVEVKDQRSGYYSTKNAAAPVVPNTTMAV